MCMMERRRSLMLSNDKQASILPVMVVDDNQSVFNLTLCLQQNTGRTKPFVLLKRKVANLSKEDGNC